MGRSQVFKGVLAQQGQGVTKLTTSLPGATYDPVTIRLHWITVILVAALWVGGETADWFPRGPLRNGYWSAHVALGFALALLLIGRLIWRGTGGRRLPASDTGILHVIAEAMHYALYILLLAVITLGIVNAFVRGYNLFGIVSLPQLGDRALRRPITEWHGLAANILLGLACMHAAAALGHHYVLKDGVLRRMLPRRQQALLNP
jgi:cytochrome b561